MAVKTVYQCWNVLLSIICLCLQVLFVMSTPPKFYGDGLKFAGTDEKGSICRGKGGGGREIPFSRSLLVRFETWN
jgi:hypothetical protein